MTNLVCLYKSMPPCLLCYTNGKIYIHVIIASMQFKTFTIAILD